MDNLVLACEPCNFDKSDQWESVYRFLKPMGVLSGPPPARPRIRLFP